MTVSRGTDNRQRIVNAARNLFYHQGYLATSFTDIARTADIPRGNFYYYYKTKDELLSDVINSRVDILRTQLDEWDQTLDEPKARLSSFLSLLLRNEEEIVRYGCPLGTLNCEMSKTDTAHMSRAIALFEVALAWLAHQFCALGYADESPMLAMHLFGGLQGAAILSQAYRNTRFLHYEIQTIKEWLQTL
jgi:TetR/AcrR family transcriptional repressor of nem operon